MARDATPNRIKIADREFRTDAHKNVAETIVDNWEPGITLKDIYKDLEGPNTSKSLFQKVYNEYMGFSEEQFGDGIEDPRTIEQIKKDHGRVSKYVEKRKKGQVDESDFRHYLDPEELEPREPPEPSESETPGGLVTVEEAIEMSQEAYRKGWEDRGKES